MKRVAKVFLMLFAVTAFAQSDARGESIFSLTDWMGGGGDCGDCGGCDDCCDDCGGGLYFQAEALFFKYHKADGVRAGNFNNAPPVTTDDVEFQHVATPRITLGYVGAGGLGVRARYWEYDQAGTARFPGTGVNMGVDTWTLDLELFERIQLNDCWDFEISGGLRYNEFHEDIMDPIPPANRMNAFSGFGGVVALEGRRTLGRWGSVYARARGAILHDDKMVSNTGAATPPATFAVQGAELTEATHSVTELAIGYELSRQTDFGLFFLRAGYEWQQWSNYSTHFTLITSTPPGNPGASYSGPADVGFSGVALSLGFER